MASSDDELRNRVEMLEITVDDLTGLRQQVQRLDGRVESLDRQFLHLREEMSGEFSAVRREAAGEFAAVRREMAAGFAAVRREIKDESNETRGQFSKLQEQMLRLHEEVMGQIAILQVDGRETRSQLLALYESLRTDIRSLREG